MAIARPMPREPPVTTATPPVRARSSMPQARYLAASADRASRSGGVLADDTCSRSAASRWSRRPDGDAVVRPAAGDAVDEKNVACHGLRLAADAHGERGIRAAETGR